MSDDKILNFPKIKTPKKVTTERTFLTNERSFDELVEMVRTPEGALDLSALDKLPAVGYNGGVKCDVTKGPCSCGAWHLKGE